MLEENISEKSGFVRLALGVGMTACGIAHLVKENGSRSLGTFFITAGAMKIAEGIFLYCPTKALMNTNVKNAVTSSMQEFMDGDSLMTAFTSRYQSSSSSQNNSSQNTGSSSTDITIKNMSDTANKIAQTVASSTPAGSPANTAAKAVQAVTNTQKNQGSQSQTNQNSQGNQNLTNQGSQGNQGQQKGGQKQNNNKQS
ncbi:MAG: hypothetical protein GX072_11445 [Lysinibacillus sp.]|nr:hypothetical protein [Lysinibacillus sp.]